MALTFDDGPTPGTVRLLDLLAEQGAKATFFLCGTQVRRLPQVARRIAAEGHEVGNHTDTHRRLWRLPAREIAGEIAKAQVSIFDASGHKAKLFRAPYGVRWFGLRQAQREFDLLGVMWTVLARDWVLDAASIAHRVKAGAASDAIVCLHDGRELAPAPDISNTIQAVQQLLPALREKGFEFETVSQLLCPTT